MSDEFKIDDDLTVKLEGARCLINEKTHMH